MKKFFVLMMVAAMSIACGGNNAEKKEGEVKLTVEQQAKDYEKQLKKLTTEMVEAMMAGDEKKAEKLHKKAVKLEKEMVDWYDSLSEEDKAKVDEATML